MLEYKTQRHGLEPHFPRGKTHQFQIQNYLSGTIHSSRSVQVSFYTAKAA